MTRCVDRFPEPLSFMLRPTLTKPENPARPQKSFTLLRSTIATVPTSTTSSFPRINGLKTCPLRVQEYQVLLDKFKTTTMGFCVHVSEIVIVLLHVADTSCVFGFLHQQTRPNLVRPRKNLAVLVELASACKV
jgi:hypothetical protein